MAQCTVSSPVPKKKRKPTGLTIPTYFHANEERPPITAIQQVTPYLFISNYSATRCLTAMQTLGITNVLNLVGAEKCPPIHPDACTYSYLVMPDNPRIDITFFMYEALEHIDEVMNAGGKILVHCVQGLSRAPTIACAYLMWKFRLSLETALAEVRTVHPDADPNIGFLSQLSGILQGDAGEAMFAYSQKYKVFMPVTQKCDCMILRRKELMYSYVSVACEPEERTRLENIMRLVGKFEPLSRIVQVTSLDDLPL